MASQQVNLTGISTLSFDRAWYDDCVNNGGCGAGASTTAEFEVIIDATNSAGLTGTTVYTWTTYHQLQLVATSGPATATITGLNYSGNCTVKFVEITQAAIDVFNQLGSAPSYFVDNIQGNLTPNGTITSTPIYLNSILGATNWSQLQWNQTQNGGTVTFAVQKCVSGTWTNVSGLTAISSGSDGANTYDVSSIPITTSADSIRIIATLGTGVQRRHVTGR